MEKNNVLHIVMFPWLAIGHLGPSLRLAKILARKGHKISFVSTPRNIKRLPKIPSNLAHLIDLVTFPLPQVENLSPHEESSMDIPNSKAQFLKIAFDLLKSDLLTFLENSRPKPDWILYDYASFWLPSLAAELGISTAYLCLFSAAFMGFLGPPSFLMSGEDGRSKGEDYTVVPKWVPFESDVAYRLHEVMKNFDGESGNESGTSDSVRFGASIAGCDLVLIRTSIEFEPEWLHLVSELYKKPVVPGINARLLNRKKVGFEIPRNDKDGTFTIDSVADLLRMAMVSEEGESVRNNAKEIKGLFTEGMENDKYIANFVSQLESIRASHLML
ncbi:hypothetical protein ACET3Z_003637 [Daucus carota]